MAYRAAKAAPIVSRGAVAVERSADLADGDVVFTMVSDSDDLLQITTGADGVLIDPGQSPALLVDFSTVSMDASAAVREAGRKRDTDFLAAPVSGNPKVVSAGKLSLAVSGPQDTFTAAEPLPAPFGARVIYVGDDEVARAEDFATLILERARRSGITLAAENVKVDGGQEAL